MSFRFIIPYFSYCANIHHVACRFPKFGKGFVWEEGGFGVGPYDYKKKRKVREELLARAALRILQLRLTPLMRFALGLADAKGSAAVIFGFVEFVVCHVNSSL